MFPFPYRIDKGPPPFLRYGSSGVGGVPETLLASSSLCGRGLYRRFGRIVGLAVCAWESPRLGEGKKRGVGTRPHPQNSVGPRSETRQFLWFRLETYNRSDTHCRAVACNFVVFIATDDLGAGFEARGGNNVIDDANHHIGVCRLVGDFVLGGIGCVAE